MGNGRKVYRCPAKKNVKRYKKPTWNNALGSLRYHFKKTLECIEECVNLSELESFTEQHSKTRRPRARAQEADVRQMPSIRAKRQCPKKKTTTNTRTKKRKAPYLPGPEDQRIMHEMKYGFQSPESINDLQTPVPAYKAVIYKQMLLMGQKPNAELERQAKLAIAQANSSDLTWSQVQVDSDILPGEASSIELLEQDMPNSVELIMTKVAETQTDMDIEGE